MKRIPVLLSLLVLSAISCYGSALTVPDPVTVPPVTVTLVPTVTVAPAATTQRQCARVIAAESVNVRDSRRAVIGQLYYDQTVDVISKAGDWWLVRRGGLSGRVRSLYLGECE